MKDNFHINQELALFAVLGIMVVLFWHKPNSKKSRNVRVKQIFAKPPSAFGVFFAKTIILGILVISASALIEYSTNIADYEDFLLQKLIAKRSLSTKSNLPMVTQVPLAAMKHHPQK